MANEAKGIIMYRPGYINPTATDTGHAAKALCSMSEGRGWQMIAVKAHRFLKYIGNTRSSLE